MQNTTSDFVVAAASGLFTTFPYVWSLASNNNTDSCVISGATDNPNE